MTNNACPPRIQITRNSRPGLDYAFNSPPYLERAAGEMPKLYQSMKRRTLPTLNRIGEARRFILVSSLATAAVRLADASLPLTPHIGVKLGSTGVLALRSPLSGQSLQRVGKSP